MIKQIFKLHLVLSEIFPINIYLVIFKNHVITLVQQFLFKIWSKLKSGNMYAAPPTSLSYPEILENRFNISLERIKWHIEGF